MKQSTFDKSANSELWNQSPLAFFDTVLSTLHEAQKIWLVFYEQLNLLLLNSAVDFVGLGSVSLELCLSQFKMICQCDLEQSNTKTRKNLFSP